MAWLGLFLNHDGLAASPWTQHHFTTDRITPPPQSPLGICPSPSDRPKVQYTAHSRFSDSQFSLASLLLLPPQNSAADQLIVHLYEPSGTRAHDAHLPFSVTPDESGKLILPTRNENWISEKINLRSLFKHLVFFSFYIVCYFLFRWPDSCFSCSCMCYKTDWHSH